MFLAIIRLSTVFCIALAVSEAADVMCLQRVPIHSCASVSCRVAGNAITSDHYPCDCFETEIVLGKKQKWYKIELPNGHHGYVADAHCSGKVPHCE
ncbi:unnamed protein product [Adineta steineri]|uniref:SH3 domain-containing protein n=1 Tax=Adineta steineri TaxID=433720 RepID=A0A813ZXE7_9BILA|nr:unnamed protein product [Adineta steineri]CAF1014566.1 unnamed protein product [Adineta steineri]CAF3619978.1 unnamed protein product [Adineta steineri]CAF3643339.1 unnamed protein product [Adineta steineri]